MEKAPSKEKENTVEEPIPFNPTLAQQLVNNLLKPSVIVVILASVLGPWAVANVSNKIEQKRLQFQVVKTLTTITSQNNLDEIGAKRLRIISTFINDNNDVIGLKFPAVEKLIKNQRLAELKKIRQLQDLELAKANSRYLSYEDQLETKNKALESSKRKLKMLTVSNKIKEKNIISKRIITLKKEVDSLEKQTTDAFTKRAELQSDLEKRNNSITKLKNELQLLATNSKKSLEALRLDIQNKRELINKLQVTIKELRDQTRAYEYESNIISNVIKKEIKGPIQKHIKEISKKENNLNLITSQLNKFKTQKTPDKNSTERNALREKYSIIKQSISKLNNIKYSFSIKHKHLMSLKLYSKPLGKLAKHTTPDLSLKLSNP
ncbi:hypothetical protein MNBD_GAMMA12-3270 [hydrothermal vent metagenome]|uniref:Uncharacterized protein n=1 Tax=hydrothermal vent metagenome TaxID=652676 RepID=A0A3B0YTU1_9ZZZZ